VAPDLLRHGEIGPSETLRSVLRGALPLGVACRLCLHRGLVDPKKLAERLGSNTPLAQLRFRCSKCRRRDVEVETFRSRSSVRRFMRPD